MKFSSSHNEPESSNLGPVPVPPGVSGADRLLGGLLIRKTCWKLSLGGKFLVLAMAGIMFVGAIHFIHPFLAVTHREQARILVVEGWVNHYGIDGALQEFKTGHYEQVFTTGGPLEGMGASSSIYNTEAYQSAALLRKAGMPADSVQSVPALYVGKDRTYNSAVAFRNWLQEHNLQGQSFNVLTEDAHARRTWLLFREAFGKSARIGIISVPNPDYDARHWWRTSEGVREVIDESIAYVYAKFFFWPSSV